MVLCNEFIEIIKNEKEAHSDWFSLIEENKATEYNIFEIEKRLKIKIPKEYRCVLLNFPVGYFAFIIIYSLLDNSEFNIEKINTDYHHLSKDYLLFSENQMGDFYGFKINNGIALSEIWFYDHEVNSWEETVYANIYELIYNIGLKLNLKNRPN